MLTSKFTSDDGTTRPDYPCVGLELKDGGGLSWHVSSLGARRAVACDGPQAERGDRSPGASAAAAGHRPRRGVFDVTLIVTAEQIGF